MKKIFFILIFAYSCNSVKDSFYEYNYTEWLSVDRIDYINETYVNSKNNIQTISGQWLYLMKFSNVTYSYCILYHPPIGNFLGVLKISKVDRGMQCDTNLELNTPNMLENIKKFKIFYKDKIGLHFLVEFNDSKEDYSFKFMNIPKKNIFKKHSHPIVGRDSLGILVIPNFYEYASNKSKLIGNFEDNYQDGTFKFCDDCSKCRFGWYKVLSKNGVKKICGIDRCGEKGMPSCLDGTPYGFCQKNLYPNLDSKEIYTCI